MLNQSLLAFLLLQCIFYCLATRTSSPSTTIRAWGILSRGGDAQQERKQHYYSIGVIGATPTELDTSLESCSNMIRALPLSEGNVVVIPSDNQSTAALRVGRLNGSNETVAETLGMVCNVLIVWTDNDSAVNHKCRLDSLLRGIRRRIAAGQPKPKVVVAIIHHGKQEDSDLKRQAECDARKQSIMLDLFRDWTPSDVAMLELVTTELELEKVWREVVREEPLTDPLVDIDAFPTLVQQVHDSLKGIQSPTDEHFQLVLWTRPMERLVPPTEEEDNEPTELEPVPEPELEPEPKGQLEELKHEPAHALGDTTKLVDLTNNDNVKTIVPSPAQHENATTPQHVDWSEVLSQAQVRVRALELKQENVWLQAEDDDTVTPLLEFGSEANSILEDASNALEGASARSGVLVPIAQELRRLYDQQLLSLREFYGRQYEAVLDETNNDEDASTQAAKQSVEGFREAAQQAIPQLCRQGQELRDVGFDYVSVLQGLISDMMEATNMRQSDNEDDYEIEEETPARRVPKWLEKLAARAVVLGINYLQGWLAWQGVRKAAADRDRNMPKFPLF